MFFQKSYKNFIIIFLLGISSGLPLALILSTLKAFLLDRGFNLTVIGFFSLASLPYSIKFLFAPIIDSCAVPFLTKIFGQRRSWIILMQLFLTIFILALGASGIFSSLLAIAIFSFLIGLASASQDIVIDAYRIELFEKENQGLASGFYVYGYRIGMLISGALALILAEIFSWNAVYFLMAIFMISCVVTVFFAEETRKNWQKQNRGFVAWFKNFVIEPMHDLTTHDRWLIILLFVIFFKLGDAFAGNLTLPFLLEIGFSKIQIASIVKTFGLFATLFGVFCGGVLIKKIGIIKTLWIAAIMQMFSNLTFAYLSKIGNDANLLYLVVFAENFSGGIGDAVFVAYLSSLCNVAFSATQYALLVSLATVARSVFTSSAGIYAQNLGWYNFFIFSTILAIPGLMFLFLLTKKNIKNQISKIKM